MWDRGDTVFLGDVEYRIACCHASLGDREQALEALARALDLGFRDPGQAAADDRLPSLREDQRFRELLGLSDVEGLSRDEGWRVDVRFFAREVKRRAYAPFRHSPAEVSTPGSTSCLRRSPSCRTRRPPSSWRS